MKRIAYFGTDGCVGHYSKAIKGQFTNEELNHFEYVDQDKFYTLISSYKKIGFCHLDSNWRIAAFPASPDDDRGGCKSVVFMETPCTTDDMINAIRENDFLRSVFTKLGKQYNVELI